MNPQQLKDLAARIQRTAATELDRSIPRQPRVLTRILLSDEEKSEVAAALRYIADQLSNGDSNEGYDHSYGL